MFEGWASDLLASYLGQFLELQREQLRISLWSAWRTGLTMQNVALRPSAFDHMQLPLKLIHGSIGSLQIHVPWRALRSPVVIDLEDVEISLQLLSPEDLTPEASQERAWAAKQAQLAAQELQELAAGVSSDGSKPPEAKQGGLLWSLVQHAVTMLLRRLQLSVRNVHITVEDPSTGRSFGFKLQQLHSCTPGEVQHPSLLLAEDAGVRVHSSTAARGSIQKQLAAEGIQFYWKFGKESRCESDQSWNVLHSTDIVLHLSSKIIGSGPNDPVKVHAAAVVHSVPFTLRPCQVKDMVHCIDQMQWTSARLKYAHLRPNDVDGEVSAVEREGGRGAELQTRDWHKMWQYAVNAVLADLKGPLHAAEWQPPKRTQHARHQYVLLYRKKLETEKELESSTSTSATDTAVRVRRAASSPAFEGHPPLEQQQVPDGDNASNEDMRQPLKEAPPQPLHHDKSQPSLAPLSAAPRPSSAKSGLGPVGEQRLFELEHLLSIADIISCRTAAHHILDGSLTAPATSNFAVEGSKGTGGGALRRGLYWGLAKAASVAGYVPGGGSRTSDLLQPTESDVRELYEAVDFHPEELAGSDSGGGSTGGMLLDFSLNCMVSALSLELKSNAAEALVDLELHGLHTEVRSAGADGLTADITLNTLSGTEYRRSRDSMTDEVLVQAIGILGRGPHQPDPAAAQANTPALPPMLRLQLTAKTSTLDVLVQPLRLQATLELLQTLTDFIPPVAPDSFVGSCMAAANELSPVARAAIKAEKLMKLGPPLDLVAKFVDVEVLLTSNHESDAVLLRTGAVVLHSVGQAAEFAKHDKYLAVLSNLKHAAEAGGMSHASLDAAVASVEQHLIYQNLDFNVNALHVAKVLVVSLQNFLPVGTAGADTEASSEDPQLTSLSPKTITNYTSILYPMRLAGSLKIHRLVEDFGGAPQVKCALKLDSILASVTAETVQLFTALFAPPAGLTSAPPPVVAQQQPSDTLGPLLTSLELSLAAIDISYSMEGSHGARLCLSKGNVSLNAYRNGNGLCLGLEELELTDTSPSDSEKPPPVVGTMYRLANKLHCAKLGVEVIPSVVQDGSDTVEVQAEDLVLEGYSGEPGNFIARTNNRDVSCLSVSVSTSPCLQRIYASLENFSVGHGLILRIVALVTALTSNKEQPQASSVGAETFEEGFKSSTGQLEHLHIPETEQELASSSTPVQGPAPASVQQQQEISVELRECRLVCKYSQPPKSSGISVPAHLQDFFSLHEEVFSIELPHVSLSLPVLLPANCAPPMEQEDDQGAEGISNSSTPVVAIFGAALVIATTGYPGHPSLPAIQLPQLVMRRHSALADATDSESVASSTSSSADMQQQQQSLVLDIPALDIGVHPSHLVIATLAVQLCQRELIALLGGTSTSDLSSDAESGHRIISPSPSKDALLPNVDSSSSFGTAVAAAAAAVADVPPTMGLASGMSQIHSLQASSSAISDASIADAELQPISWSLEASLGVLGFSCLGSTASSTCLKAEWNQLTATVSSSHNPALSLDACLNWSQLSFYVLRPRDAIDGLDFTPFVGHASVFGSPIRATGSLIPAPSSPPLLQTPATAGVAGGGRPVRRSLSAGLQGLAGVGAGMPTPSIGGVDEDEPPSGESRDLATISGVSPTGSQTFFEARSSHSQQLVPRFSAGSAVSRYFSAPESEFEDAASDLMPDGSIRSPPEGRSPRLPSLLPLDTSNAEYEVQVLVCVTTASLSSSNFDMEHQQQGHHSLSCIHSGNELSIDIASVFLRVYLHGWHHVMEWAMNYQRFLTQALTRIKAAETSMPQLTTLLNGSGTADATATDGTAEVSPPGSVAAEPTLQLKIVANRVGIEAIAADGGVSASSLASASSSASVLGGELPAVGDQRQAELGREDSPAGASRIAPAGQIIARISAEIHTTPDGRKYMLCVPAALVSVGPVHVADIGNVDPLEFGPRDAILGLRDCTITGCSDNFEFEFIGDSVAASMAAGAAAAAAPLRTHYAMGSLAVHVGQASVWAGQRNLSAAAALGQHVAHMAAEITSLMHSLAAAAPAGHLHLHSLLDALEDSEGVDTGKERGLMLVRDEQRIVMTIMVDCIAVVLQTERGDLNADGSGGTFNDANQYSTATSPLFELVISDVRIQSGDPQVGDGGGVTATIDFGLALDIFNGSKLAWEPVIDPWGLSLALTVPQMANASSPGSRTAQIPHFKLEVASKQGLEVTVTSAVVDAAAAAAAIVEHVQAVAKEPDTMEQHLLPNYSSTNAAAASLPATFQLHNLTGSQIDAWLVAPLSGGAAPSRPPVGPPTLSLAACAKSALPVLSLHGGVGQSRRAGRPNIEEGVAWQSDDKGSSDETAALEPSSSSTTASGEHRRRSLLYFRFSGQGPLAGPVYLDRPDASVHYLQLGGTSSDSQISLFSSSASAKVVAETVERRHGSFTATLHSGVCVTNTSPVELHVGMQTPMGAALGQPNVLGVLRPGESTWLPAARAEVGMLCVRPSPSYRPERSGISALPSKGVLYRSGSYASFYRSPTALASGSGDGASGSGNSQTVYDWSSGVALTQLLKQSGEGSSHGATRHVSCPPVFVGAAESPSFLLSIGATLQENAWQVTFAPPFTLHNALPVPVDVVLNARWSPAMRIHLLPNDRAPMLHIEAGQVESVSLRPEGFESTPILPIAPPSAPPSDLDLSGAWQMRPYTGSTVSSTVDDETSAAGAGGILDGSSGQILVGPEVSTTLIELPPGHSTVDVSLQHALTPSTGAHSLRISCGMWIYNCAGVPLALRNTSRQDALLAQAAAEAAATADELLMLAVDDDVPESWVPPLMLQTPDGTSDLGLIVHSAAASPIRPSDLKTPRPSSALEHSTLRSGPSARLPEGLSGARTAPPEALTARSLTSIGGSMLSVGRTASVADVSGLGEILEASGAVGGGTDIAAAGGGLQGSLGPRTGVTTSPISPNRTVSVLGMQRAPSRARGIADSMDSSPTFEKPSAWPSMASGLAQGEHRLQLQLRTAPTKAPVGRTFWSHPVDLDASGGAVVTAIPSPAPVPSTAAAAALPGTVADAGSLSGAGTRGSYPVVVSTTQIPGSNGILALSISPRFILRNHLETSIQYKQQDTTKESDVKSKEVRAVRWTDDTLPPRLSVRVQEAGWLWSGGFQLDVPGDIFVKIRHRDRGVTMLVRVDVATSPNGSCQITLSHNSSGFAPYRIENCSLETLHARQKSVREQQDVLRPYCALNYAWDEPTQPHMLVLELPGARYLGTFDLDKVGQDRIVPVYTRRGEPEKELRVMVRAEGPTRVLTVVDQAHHVLPSIKSLSGGGFASRISRTTKGNPSETPLAKYKSDVKDLPRDVALSGPVWEVLFDFSSVGLSLVGPTHEVAYLRLTGAQVVAASGAARYSLSLIVQGIQLDNPSPWVAFPVTLVLPAPVSKLGRSVAAAVDAQPAPALELMVSLWQSRPADVICVEIARVQMQSLAVYLDQQHLEEGANAAAAMFAAPSISSLNTNGGMALRRPDSVLGFSSGSSIAASGTNLAELDTARSFSLGGAAASLPPLSQSGRSTPLFIGGGGGGGNRSSTVYSPARSTITNTTRDRDQQQISTAGAAGHTTTVIYSAASESPQQQQQQNVVELHESILGPLYSAGIGLPISRENSWAHRKVYMDALSISSIEVTLSFLSAPVHHLLVSHPRLAALQRLLSLADVEDARLVLAGLQLANPLMNVEALGQALQRHYLRALASEVYKVVGAASMIGDPVSLFNHLKIGVWEFVSAPAEGLWESAKSLGPRQFVLGVLRGTRGLVQNVVFAISNAATKAAGAARKAIVVWGLDRQDAPLIAGSFRRRVMFIEGGMRRGLDGEGEETLLGAVLRGLAGLISEPIRGVELEGLPGLARGLQRGVLSAVALPLAVFLEMSARFADSVRRAVAGSSNLGWLRPPRHVSPSEPLTPYNWSNAMGRWLLTELQRGEEVAAARGAPSGSGGGGSLSSAFSETFLLCIPTKRQDYYLVLTSRRVLYVRAKGLMWEPDAQWQAAVADMELISLHQPPCDSEGLSLCTTSSTTAVRFVAHPAAAKVPTCFTRASFKPPGSMFSYLCVDCCSEEAAVKVKEVAQGAVDAVLPRKGVFKLLQ